jgi:hypothetical protein
MRFRLRTLLIAIALAPPALAVGWWGYWEWRADRYRWSVPMVEPGEWRPDFYGPLPNEGEPTGGLRNR